MDDTSIGVAFSDDFVLKKGVNEYLFDFNMLGLAPGQYKFDIVLSQNNSFGVAQRIDVLNYALDFKIIPRKGYCNNLPWGRRAWGYYLFSNISKSRGQNE